MKHFKLFEEFVNEGGQDSVNEPINEDMATNLMYLLLAANTTMLWTTALASQGGGGDFTPIQDLKNWWAKRKKDKAVQSIVDKLKDDPDVIAFMNQTNSAQRGKWYKLIEPKLNDEEKKYLRSISKASFTNEEVSEGISQEAALIHTITGSGQNGAQDFIDDNNIDAKKLVDYLVQHRNSKEKYDIRDLIKDPNSNKKLLQKFVKESINEGNAASWSKAQLDKELKGLSQGVRDAGDIDDSMAFDIAYGWLSDNPGAEVAIKKHYRASDAQGFIANRIV
jgi:hypothetical protein